MMLINCNLWIINFIELDRDNAYSIIYYPLFWLFPLNNLCKKFIFYFFKLSSSQILFFLIFFFLLFFLFFFFIVFIIIIIIFQINKIICILVLVFVQVLVCLPGQFLLLAPKSLSKESSSSAYLA